MEAGRMPPPGRITIPDPVRKDSASFHPDVYDLTDAGRGW